MSLLPEWVSRVMTGPMFTRGDSVEGGVKSVHKKVRSVEMLTRCIVDDVLGVYLSILGISVVTFR